MIKHIVMFRLNADGDTLSRTARAFKEAIETLPGKIDALASAEVGLDDSGIEGNWHIVLTATCQDWDALREYSGHPEHLACVAIIKPFIGQRACVDYTI